MGVTIHYGFKLSGNDSAHALTQVERLRRRALKLPFKKIEPVRTREKESWFTLWQIVPIS